jgi:hypothetical protein
MVWMNLDLPSVKGFKSYIDFNISLKSKWPTTAAILDKKKNVGIAGINTPTKIKYDRSKDTAMHRVFA